MPYDEYEISLARELALCEQYVRQYTRRIADSRQAEPGTEAFAVREQASESLRQWSAARDEYARLLQQMRISA